MSDWYESYLESAHWQWKREQKLEQSGYQCERCGEYGRRTRYGAIIGLQVHHLNYERVHREELEDLEVLCIYCHECEHGHNKRSREQIRSGLVAGVTEYFDEDDISLEIQAWDELERAYEAVV